MTMAEPRQQTHDPHEDGSQTLDAVQRWEASVWADLRQRHEEERRRLHDGHQEQMKDLRAQHQGQEGPVEGYRLWGGEDVGTYLVDRYRQRLHHHFDTMYLESRHQQE